VSTPAAYHPARRRRKLSLRLRTLILIVAVVAAGLGWWQYHVRRLAIDRLLTVLPSGIALAGGPSFPEHDPTHSPDRGRYLTALHQVTANHGKTQAEADVTEALRNARLRGDEKSMRGALAVLLWIGRGSSATVAEVVQTAIGAGLPSPKKQGVAQIRSMAIHVLGKVAEHDDAALRCLIEVLEGSDDSFQQVISGSAANELRGLGARARAAVPALIRGLSSRQNHIPYGHLFNSSINALESIGPEARTAASELIAIAEDRKNNDFTRSDAIQALRSIVSELNTEYVEPTESHERIVTALAQLLSDDSSSVREEAGRALRGLRYSRRLTALTESHLEWLLRAEEKVLGPKHPEVAATAGQLKSLSLIRDKKPIAAKPKTREAGILGRTIQ
jgi:hypothetical protein